MNKSDTNKLSDIVDQLGFNGPFIISLIVIYLLRNIPSDGLKWNILNLQGFNTPYLWAFMLGSGINIVFNKLLKMVFKDPRPQTHDNYLGAEQYGMPSGHAQIAFFAITFYYLVKKHWTNTILLLFLTVVALTSITLYQRYAYKYHTLEQLLAGAVTGSAFAWFIVNGTRQYLTSI